MTSEDEDRSAWPRDGQIIRRDDLLRLIEENGGPEGLDLRGALFVGEGLSGAPHENPIDLRDEALQPLAALYRDRHAGQQPPWATEEGNLQLRGAQLQGATLTSARLQKADLRDAQLQGARLSSAQLQGVDLWAAQLQRARLTGAQLQGARLWDAKLQQSALWRAQLQGADLERAQLQGADLTGAQLQGAHLKYARLQDVDLYEVESLEDAQWDGALLDHTRIKRETLGQRIDDELIAAAWNTSERYDEAKEAYLLLKNNFNQIGRYEDASWAYVKEQQMEKMAYYWEAREHGWPWGGWRAFRSWLRNWAYELATGYGERPWNAVGLGVFIMAAFALGFWLTGAVSGGRPRWFTSWNPGDIDWAGLGDAITYSLATFATFNLGRKAFNPEGRGVEIASSIEALLGIAILALVVFTLGNRMSRG